MAAISITLMIEVAFKKGWTLEVVSTSGKYNPDRLPSPLSIGGIIRYELTKCSNHNGSKPIIFYTIKDVLSFLDISENSVLATVL